MPVTTWFIEALSFNPRSRGGSDHLFVCDKNLRKVSIHAPAGGATLTTLIFCRQPWPFQSTLPRGERQSLALDMAIENAFQSTLPRGERPGYTVYTGQTGDVSIHAPAGGAT